MLRFLVRTLLGLLVLLAVVGGGFAAMHWEPDRPVDALKARWAGPDSSFLNVDGMDVHLRDEGPRSDALPIVLLHGTSASLHTWDGWAAALKERRRVVRFDLPGFGLTGPHPDAAYSPEAYADFVARMLDALDIDEAVIAGNSLGGRVARTTAVRHPERVAGLVLVDASGYPMRSESVPIGFRIARMPVVSRLMESVLPRSMVRSSLENVYGDPEKVTPELVDRYFELTLRAGNRGALAERMRQRQPGANAELIPTIDQPTLILWGRQDRLIPLTVGERFDADIPDSELIVWDSLGHVPQEEAPEETVEPVIQFLDKLERLSVDQ